MNYLIVAIRSAVKMLHTARQKTATQPEETENRLWNFNSLLVSLTEINDQ
jgi:hypothetical protein